MSYVGYTAALHAAWLALNLLPVQAWRQDQVGRAQAFVLAVLDLIPRTGALPVQLACEVSLVALIERFMYPSKYGAFCGAVLAKWRSAAVTEVLRARGTLSGDPAAPPPRPVLG